MIWFGTTQNWSLSNFLSFASRLECLKKVLLGFRSPYLENETKLKKSRTLEPPCQRLTVTWDFSKHLTSHRTLGKFVWKVGDDGVEFYQLLMFSLCRRKEMLDFCWVVLLHLLSVEELLKGFFFWYSGRGRTAQLRFAKIGPYYVAGLTFEFLLGDEFFQR
jgi:hypothetical protein